MIYLEMSTLLPRMNFIFNLIRQLLLTRFSMALFSCSIILRTQPVLYPRVIEKIFLCDLTEMYLGLFYNMEIICASRYYKSNDLAYFNYLIGTHFF